MRVTLLQVKVVHTVVFAVLSACVLHTLYSAVFGRITAWTWVAVALVLVESIVLVSFGWTCPMTILAENLGASHGAVAECGTTFARACLLLVLRLLEFLGAGPG